VYIRHPGRAAAEGEGETADAGNPTPQQPDGNGAQERVPSPVPVVIRAATGQEDGRVVPSDGALGDAFLPPALKRLRVATSMLGGHRVLDGGGADQEQPDSGSPPRLGGRVLFINGYF
jgi:hypothetical protein